MQMKDYRNGLGLSVLPQHFLVCSISPEPFERFSLNFGQMFALVRDVHAYSRSRSQLKVTSLSFEFHVHSISPEPFERYLLNLGQISEMICRAHNSTMQTQGQGHN